MMSGLPLEGYTVIEMGSALAGPYGARILGDLGARVIKVEPPGAGESGRAWGRPVHKGAGPLFNAVNRAKDSLEIDFNSPADVARLKRIITQKADVVIQNLRPDVTEKAGLDAASCRALNPALIYCNISAFGPDGPLARDAGYEALLQAFSGLMEMTGTPDSPARIPVSINDFGTAMWAAIGILSALLKRERSGQGCVVEASIFDTSIGWSTLAIALMQATGERPERTGMRGPLLAPNRGFRCADGMLMITAGTNAQFSRLCGILGCEELLDDPRFADNELRMANDAALTGLLETVLVTQNRDHWWQKLRAGNVPSAPVQALDETVYHPHTHASGILQDAPDGGPVNVSLPLRLDGVRPDYHRSIPALGEGTDDLQDM